MAELYPVSFFLKHNTFFIPYFHYFTFSGLAAASPYALSDSLLRLRLLFFDFICLYLNPQLSLDPQWTRAPSTLGRYFSGAAIELWSLAFEDSLGIKCVTTYRRFRKRTLISCSPIAWLRPAYAVRGWDWVSSPWTQHDSSVQWELYRSHTSSSLSFRAAASASNSAWQRLFCEFNPADNRTELLPYPVSRRVEPSWAYKSGGDQ